MPIAPSRIASYSQCDSGIYLVRPSVRCAHIP
jgi:hypothetical protein